MLAAEKHYSVKTLCLKLYFAVARGITGFVRVMGNLESHEISEFFFSRPGKSWNSIAGPRLERQGKLKFRVVTADVK